MKELQEVRVARVIWNLLSHLNDRLWDRYEDEFLQLTGNPEELDGVGKHSHKKATILATYTDGSNLSCAYVSEGADLMSKIVLGIGIFSDLSVPASPEAGSLR